MPTFYMGPLFTRVFRQESLWNGGKVVEYRGCAEKPCQHNYVEGTVRGTASAYPAGTIVVSPEGGSFQTTDTLMGGQCVWTCDCVVEAMSNRGEGSGNITYKATCVRTYRFRNVIQTVETGGLEFSMRCFLDVYTKALSYSSPVLLRRWGYGATVAYIAASSCPIPGSLGDNFAAGTGLLEAYVAKARKVAGNVGDTRAARDEAIWRAIDNIEIGDINALNDVTDALSPIATLRSLAETFSQMSGRGGLRFLKGISSLKLFWDYVVKTNIMAAEQVAQISTYLATTGSSLATVSNSDLVGRGTSSYEFEGGTVEYTAKVVYQGVGWGPTSTLSSLKLQGLIPTVEDVWDLIPYSFVVDWLLPVGRTIGRMEKMGLQLQLPLLYVMYSRKIIRDISHTFSSGSHMFDLNAKDVDYHRWVRRSLPADMGLGQAFRFTDPRKHSINALALLVQRL